MEIKWYLCKIYTEITNKRNKNEVYDEQNGIET